MGVGALVHPSHHAFILLSSGPAAGSGQSSAVLPHTLLCFLHVLFSATASSCLTHAVLPCTLSANLLCCSE